MSTSQQHSNPQSRPLTAQEELRLLLSRHLQRLVAADPKAAREALEMSQEQAPELHLIAQNEPQSNWAEAVMNSDSMQSLMSRSPSQVKALLEKPDLQSLLEMLP